MTKIAAAMILGDQFDSDELRRCFTSLHHAGVDQVFINFNGKSPATGHEIGVIALKGKIKALIQPYEWNHDFALARQQSFDMVPKDEYDWILWIDSDDIIVPSTDLVTLLDDIPSKYSGVFIKYNYAIDPTTDHVVVEQWRERFLRTNVKWKWNHPIHEVCNGPAGTQFIRKNGVVINHLRKSGEDRGARKRNRHIIAKAMREHPEVARYKFYFAGETMAEADGLEDVEQRITMAHSAILAYTDFKDQLGEINDDYYVAQIRIAECFRMAGQMAEALQADLDAIAIYPDWPDAYIGAAKTTMENADWARMKAFADIATKLGKPATSISIESMNYDFTPVFLRGIANEQLGNYQQALDDFELARSYWNPSNNKLDEKIAEVKDILANGPKISEAEKQLTKSRNTKPDKSIAFLTTPLPENWHPELMKIDGSGGAELCIMKIAAYFAADGWRVSVYGTPGMYRGINKEDGVEYWDSNDYLSGDQYKVLVSSRTTAPFHLELNCEKKLLWMHDVNAGKDLLKVKDAPDKILALTPWHRNHLITLYGLNPNKVEIIPNGVDINRFPKKFSESGQLGQKFIWSSSYDRGLETVLGLWPKIKQNLPDATLDIFYGWNMYNKSIEQWKNFNTAQANALLEFQTKIEYMMKKYGNNGESGITHHGRVNQTELATYMLGSDIWPYTTEFMETFCITAIEMQAAGVIPITTALAALNDNIAVKKLTIDGWAKNVAYQNQFLDLLFAMYEAPQNDILKVRQEGRRLAETMSWDSSYSKWRDMLKKIGV